MTLIKDPVRSTGARVSSDGRLWTYAIRKSLESQASHEGKEFLVSLVQGGVDRTLTLAAGNTYNLAYLRNLDDDEFLTLISISGGCDVAGGLLFAVRNPTEGTLANNVSVEPVNDNFSSSLQANIEAHVWDEVGTAGIGGLTGGTEFFSTVLGAGPFSIPASSHLGLNGRLLLGVENPTGGAIEIALNVNFIKERIDQIG